MSLRRSGTGWLDGYWSVPAGALDGNEPLAAAAAREVLEEVGVPLPAANARLAHVQQVFMPDAEWLGLYFEFEYPDLEPRMMEPDKHDRMEWLDLLSISEPVVPYVRAALSDIAKGSNHSTFTMQPRHV